MKERLVGRQSVDAHFELALGQVNMMHEQLLKLQGLVKENIEQWKGMV